MKERLRNSRVLITGGTGTFGRAFLDECIREDAKEIVIFSRDEKKQYDMAQEYKNHRNVRFFLGDIRDKRSVDAAMFGIDFVFHAAAMKQVPSCESYPIEAMKTNIKGSENVLLSAIQHRVKKVVCLSTDKAVYPTSAMGLTKAYMEKLAIQKSTLKSGTEVCITRFGNLIASRGSAVPLFLEQIEKGLPITITEPEMTRFLMTVDDAVKLVKHAFESGRNGQILVKKAKACKTGDLAKAVKWYLNVDSDYPTHIIGIRPGEKMHESLLTDEEAAHAVEIDGHYITYKNCKPTTPIADDYSSDKAELITIEEIVEILYCVFGEVF